MYFVNRLRSSSPSVEPHIKTQTRYLSLYNSADTPPSCAIIFAPRGRNTWGRVIIPLKSKAGWHTKDMQLVDPDVMTRETSWNTKPLWVLFLLLSCSRADVYVDDHLFPVSDTPTSAEVWVIISEWNVSGQHMGTWKQQRCSFRSVRIWRLPVTSFENEILRHKRNWTRKFIDSNKSPTRCKNFSVYYPDVYLQLNLFRALSCPSSGAQWLQWQPLVLPSYRGDSRAVFVVGPAGDLFELYDDARIYKT